MKKRKMFSLQIVWILIIMLFIPLFIEAQVAESGYYWTDLDGNSNFEPFEFTVPVNTETSRTEPVQMPGWPINIGTATNQSPSGICLSDINGDGSLEIIVGSPNGHLHVFNYLGNNLPGWPKTGLEPIRAKVAVGDIDPDYPGLEIVAVGQTNSLYVWHNDGTTVSGFPKAIGNYGILKAPVISDIDCDGNLEIIVGQNSVRVYNHDGTIYPGWPQSMDTTCWGTPAVADVDNDGVFEICAVSNYSIYLWDKDGNDKPGWPLLNVAGRADFASPAFADLDGDGDLEILHAYYDQPGARSINHIGIYHHDGTCFDNWPQNYPGTHTYLTPVVGDIDNDGDLEIFNGGHSFDLGAKHHTGANVAGWPVSTTAALECSPIVFDLDNDGYRDVVFGENMWDPYGDFWAFSGNGSLLEDWPIDIVHATMVNSAAVGDVDGDGDIEIALIVKNGTVSLWTVEDIPYRKYLTEWGTYYHDNWNTGWYHPLPPQNPTATISGNSVYLNWIANTEPDLSGYNVYMSDDSGISYTKLNDELIVDTSYTDESGAANYLYCITAEIFANAESKFSNEAIFQTSFIEGTVSLDGGTGNVEEVTITAGSISANPDITGFYSIGIAPGTYDVTASLDGYEPETIEGVVVEESQTTSEIDFVLSAIVGVDGETFSIIPKLIGNYPNPFNPSTTISFSVTQTSSFVTLEIYNLKGQKVKQLVVDQLSAGQHSVVWNGKDDNGKPVSSGIYFYQLKEGKEISQTKRMLLLK